MTTSGPQSADCFGVRWDGRNIAGLQRMSRLETAPQGDAGGSQPVVETLRPSVHYITRAGAAGTSE